MGKIVRVGNSKHTVGIAYTVNQMIGMIDLATNWWCSSSTWCLHIHLENKPRRPLSSQRRRRSNLILYQEIDGLGTPRLSNYVHSLTGRHKVKFAFFYFSETTVMKDLRESIVNVNALYFAKIAIALRVVSGWTIRRYVTCFPVVNNDRQIIDWLRRTRSE